jgi:hypothetical protein
MYMVALEITGVAMAIKIPQKEYIISCLKWPAAWCPPF